MYISMYSQISYVSILWLYVTIDLGDGSVAIVYLAT